MAHKVAAVVFSLGFVQASSVMALGLGELELDSFLNQPLNASVDLLNIGSLHNDEIKVRLATRDDFEKLGLERSYFLTSIQFEVVHEEGDSAKIVLTTDESVLEPYLDFVIEARWPNGRLLREYTILVDPPAFSYATPVVSASARVAEVEGIPEPAKKSPAEAAAATGTRVEVTKTNLAPGEMPQRNFNASAQSPVPGARYMIPRDQTLWDIASKAKPEGASVYQTMLDIQRLNPNAFINGNINRIKAGYIVYLPTSADISSSDVQRALVEVSQQNAAWEQGKDADLYASGGPSLRISADVEPGISAAAADGGNASGGLGDEAPDDGARDATTAGKATDVVIDGELDGELDGAITERLTALEHQLTTLNRIVTLKDEQIAALQSALSENSTTGGAASAPASNEDLYEPLNPEPSADEGYDAQLLAVEEESPAVVADGGEAVEVREQVVADLEGTDGESESTVKSALPKPIAAPEPEPESNWLAWLLYGLGAAILAALGFLFLRRRNAGEDDIEKPAVAPAADVFASVELPDAPVALEEPEVDEVPEGAARGYGERRHDEYAADVEAADALAEADIYIAYGRHPQAIELLNNALTNEPNNPVYRLKLLEIHSELDDQAAAQEQLHQIRGIGDADATAQAEGLLSGETVSEAAAEEVPAQRVEDAPGLPPNPLAMMDTAVEQPLEADFSGLEIEQDDPVDEEDDLDLSADFEDPDDVDHDEEELVIAADSNGLSTKLDLARAYLDMGDDEGARQILNEIVAEGGDDLKAEAQSLLERIV